MKTDKALPWSLRLLNGAYLLCTLFGVLFYSMLPIGLNQFGARSYVYLFWFAWLNEEISRNTGYLLLGLAAILLLFALGIGVYALIKKQYGLQLIAAVLDIVLTLVLLVWRGMGIDGALYFNVLYCAFLAYGMFLTSAEKS